MTDAQRSGGDGRPDVLVVEDEQDLADLYAHWLESDYEVHTAYTGEEALEQLTDDIDVVLLDRRMPDVSGDAILETIREDGLDARVVVVSAVTPDFDVVDMAFDDYLTKPVDREDIRDAVETMCEESVYDDTIQEYHRAVATKSTLRAEKTQQELRASEEYAELEQRIDDLQSDADAALADLSTDGFDAAFRGIDSDSESAELDGGKR